MEGRLTIYLLLPRGLSHTDSPGLMSLFQAWRPVGPGAHKSHYPGKIISVNPPRQPLRLFTCSQSLGPLLGSIVKLLWKEVEFWVKRSSGAINVEQK